MRGDRWRSRDILKSVKKKCLHRKTVKNKCVSIYLGFTDIAAGSEIYRGQFFLA